MTDAIVLGLDGATWDVLDPLIEAGRLPNLARLRREGYDGVLESTFPPITAPAWLSMATGQNPGKTGVFYFQNRTDPDSFSFEMLGSDEFEGRSFWDVIDARGRSVGVFNFPMLYPPYALDNGFQVSGLGAPEDDSITAPAELRAELDEVTDGYTVKVPYADPKYSGRPDALLTDLHEALRTRSAAIEHLLTDRRPSVFFGVVSVTDWAQHYFWRYYDETHALYDPEVARDHGDALGELWERVDETVGMVADVAEREGAVLFVVSDHGFGPVNETFHSNTWLEATGFQAAGDRSLLTELRTTYFQHLRRVGEPIAAAVPQLNDLITAIGRRIRGSPEDTIDMEDSLVFAPRQNFTCGMLFMLSDDPADEQAVVDALESLTREDGQPVDPTVYRAEDLYHGDRLDVAPDVLFEIDGFECGVDPRPRADDAVFTTGPPSVARSGGHRRDGIYVVAGEGVEPGSGGRRSLLDVAPTLLYALDTPIPEVMDGEALTDAFTPEFRANRTLRRAPLADLVTVEAAGGRGDTEAMQDRLEDLGYI